MSVADHAFIELRRCAMPPSHEANDVKLCRCFQPRERKR